MQRMIDTAIPILISTSLRAPGAFALWRLGRLLIRIGLRLVARELGVPALDPTLSRYVQSALAVALNVALVVAILGMFGVETTAFAALIAAGGVAIGMAWSGLLSNFAAGA